MSIISVKLDDNMDREGQHSTLSLNVINLSYKPRRNIIYTLIQIRDCVFSSPFLKELFPQAGFDVFNPAELYSVNFRAFPNQITAILSNSSEELRTVIDFLASSRYSGSFDGEILLDGVNNIKHYNDTFAFVPKKTTFLSGLTFGETLFYAARLRLNTTDNALIAKRVDQIFKMLDIDDFKDCRIEECDERCSQIKRLSIGVEIIALPSMIVLDDPTQGLEPAAAMTIMKCLQFLAAENRIVICGMSRPPATLFALVDNVVAIFEGRTIFSASTKNIVPFFSTLGYEYNASAMNLADFIIDIASGIERPVSERVPFSGISLQEAFEKSAFYCQPVTTWNAISALPRSSYIADFCYEAISSCSSLSRFLDEAYRQIKHTYIVTRRAVQVKIRGREIIQRSLGGSIILATWMGYLQFRQGNYGYYTITITKFPYPNTCNVTSLLFFVCAFIYAFQGVNAQVVCQRVKAFRHEQKLGYQSATAFLLSSIVVDLPFVFVYTLAFSAVIYFMTQLGFGLPNFIFFVKTLTLLAFVGTTSTYLFAAILTREIRVRDCFIMTIIGMLLTAGFAFQLKSITTLFSGAALINPIRWTFEALMKWKFGSHYEDGLVYLEPFGFDVFEQDDVFVILGRFLFISFCSTFLVSLPTISTLTRVGQSKNRQSLGNDSDTGSDQMHNSMNYNLHDDGAQPPQFNPSSSMRPSASMSRLARPLLFDRETSVTSESKLSINVSQMDPSTRSNHGPTVTFKNIYYRVRNRYSESGFMTVLNSVSGQFDWGKLNLVLGARASGRSSLLHILAGDKGLASEITGEIRFDGELVNPKLPLWLRCGLVEAQDEQHRDLSVEEVITFAMKLRCPSREALKLVEENVRRTIEILHLDKVRHKKSKKLSVGERRRLSIAEEICHGPSLLLIDEPTTGQDVLDEAIMMQTFREMVNQDRTVVAAVHTPSARTLQLFDRILLLSKGHVIFHGPTKDAVPFFTQSPFGFSMRDYDNQGDFLTDLSGGHVMSDKGDYIGSGHLAAHYKSSGFYKYNESISNIPGSDIINDSRLSNFITTKSSDAEGFNLASFFPTVYATVPGEDKSDDSHETMLLEDKYRDREVSVFRGRHTLSSDRRRRVFVKGYPQSGSLYLTPFILWASVASAYHFFLNLPRTNIRMSIQQSRILLHRSALAMYRRPKLWVGATLIHVLLAVTFGWMLGDCSLQVYNTTSLYGVGALLILFTNIQIVYYFFRIHLVFLKEHSRGLYSVFLYWMVTSSPLYLLRLTNAVLYAIILIKMTNLGSTPEIFTALFVTSICISFVGTAFSEAVIMFVESLRSVYLFITGAILFFFMFSGLFIKQQSLPDWLHPIPALSPIRWTLQGEFVGTYEENTTVFPEIGATSTYELFLTLFSWNGISSWFCIYMLLANIAVFRVLTLVAAGLSAMAQKGGRKFRKEENISRSLNVED